MRLAWWAGTFVVFALADLVVVWVIIALAVVFYRALRWAIRVDRARKDAIDEADEIAAIRRFHETLDGTLDKILRKGEK